MPANLQDDFEIVHCSFPRTVTQWIRCIINEYLTKVDFKYKWDFSHSVLWNKGNFYSYRPVMFSCILNKKYFENARGVYRHYLYTHRLDYKRVSYSNFKKILEPTRSTKWYAKHFLEVYIEHTNHIESILSKYDYPWVSKFVYEDFLNDPVDKFSEAIESISLQNLTIDKDILNKVIQNWSDKKAISLKTIYHEEWDEQNQNYRRYLEPDYEDKYEEFLNEYGDMLDKVYESAKLYNT